MIFLKELFHPVLEDNDDSDDYYHTNRFKHRHDVDEIDDVGEVDDVDEIGEVGKVDDIDEIDDDVDHSFPGEEDEEGDLAGFDDEGGELEGENDDSEISQVVDKATENPDKQGFIRKVPSAHLVYKHEEEDGTYEELWMYSCDDMRKAMDIRKSVLSGTDIPMHGTSSPDDKQTYNLWTAGNVEMMCISGLPN